VRRGEAMGVVFIGDSASTIKEVNRTPPWTRYSKDQRDKREDWGSLELGGVWPHLGCTCTPSSSPWFEFLYRYMCMHGDPSDASVRLRFNSITV
jgi:hypothetical protein